MIDVQIIFLAVFAAFVLGILALSIVSHIRYARGLSRSQRTMTDTEIDVAVDAMSNPDADRRDTRPLRKRRRRVWWTSLGGTHFLSVTRRED